MRIPTLITLGQVIIFGQLDPSVPFQHPSTTILMPLMMPLMKNRSCTAWSHPNRPKLPCLGSGVFHRTRHVSGAMQLRCCDLLPRRVGAVRRRSASTHGTGRLEQLGSTSWGMMFASSCSECLHVHGMLFWKLNLRRGRIGQMESVSGGGQRCNARNRRFAGGNCGTRTHGLPLAAINLGAQPT